jgi:hypothetical protein
LTLVVLVILAALWAVVLVPPLLRSRTVRSNDSIGDFNYRLDALGRTNGALTVEKMRTVPGQRAAKRRRDVTRVLLIAVGATALLALATGMAAIWVLQIFADMAFFGYFALWAYVRSLQDERVQKVRPMPVARARRELPLSRAASS